MILSNAQAIIDAITGFLDRFMLKKNKLTTASLLTFVEAKWAEAMTSIKEASSVRGWSMNMHAPMMWLS
jgi:hypothetical protein